MDDRGTWYVNLMQARFVNLRLRFQIAEVYPLPALFLACSNTFAIAARRDSSAIFTALTVTCRVVAFATRVNMKSFAFTTAAMIGMCLHTAEAAYKFTEPDDLLDCGVNNVVCGSDVIYDKKITGKPFYYCSNDMRPKLPTNGCSNLTATATITSVDVATETSPEKQHSETGAGKGGENSATAIGMRHSWLGLRAALVVAGVFMA
ncbi:hypothetical protein B0O99DRAFT_672216 [Bisporella sp. PMI_857]|nr:hypothetical protein B0O99DRAFT_672216 [Bisporella sp. PMI_857]